MPSTDVRRGRFADDRRIGRGWSRVVAVGWVGITLGLASVGASSQIIGRPVWWADDVRWGTIGALAIVIGIFVVCTGIVIQCFLGGSWIPQTSAVGGLLLGVVALADRHSSPGGAVVTASLGVAALLLGIGALSDRRPDQGVDRDSASTESTSV